MSSFPIYPHDVTPTNKLLYLVQKKNGEIEKIDGGVVTSRSQLPQPGDGKVINAKAGTIDTVIVGNLYAPHSEYTWTVTASEL